MTQTLVLEIEQRNARYRCTRPSDRQSYGSADTKAAAIKSYIEVISNAS